MYGEFYGFHEKPFSLLPDPDFLFLSEKHETALNLLELAVLNQSGFCTISGDIGTGKTTIVRELLNRLDDRVCVGLISNTHFTFVELLSWIISAYGLKAESRDPVALHRQFTDFVTEQYASGKHTLLIIDEAQNLSVSAMEELRMLFNLNSGKDLMLQMMLVGQKELREKLQRPEMEQFSQRISMDYYLEALDEKETAAYIKHRVARAGGPENLFDEAAYRHIYQYSEGVPRLINRICDLSLVYGFAEHARVIDAEVVKSVAGEQVSESLMTAVGKSLLRVVQPEPSEVVVVVPETASTSKNAAPAPARERARQTENTYNKADVVQTGAKRMKANLEKEPSKEPQQLATESSRPLATEQQELPVESSDSEVNEQPQKEGAEQSVSSRPLATERQELPPESTEDEVSERPEEHAQTEQAASETLEELNAAAEKAASEKARAEKIAMEKVAAAEAALEKAAAEQAAAERAAAEKLAAEKVAEERIKSDSAAAELAAAAKAAAEAASAEKLAAEQAAVDRNSEAKLAAGKVAAEKLDAETIVAEKARIEMTASEEAAVAKAAAEKALAERLAAEKAAAETAAAADAAVKKALAERVAAEKDAATRLAAAEAAAERAMAERAEARRIATEKAAAEQRAIDKAEADAAKAQTSAAEKGAATQAADEKAAVARHAAEKAEATRLAAERAVAEQVEAEKAAAAAATVEKLAAAKVALTIAAAAKEAAEKAAAAQAAALKDAQEKEAAALAAAEKAAEAKAAADQAAAAENGVDGEVTAFPDETGSTTTSLALAELLRSEPEQVETRPSFSKQGRALAVAALSAVIAGTAWLISERGAGDSDPGSRVAAGQVTPSSKPVRDVADEAEFEAAALEVGENVGIENLEVEEKEGIEKPEVEENVKKSESDE